MTRRGAHAVTLALALTLLSACQRHEARQPAAPQPSQAAHAATTEDDDDLPSRDAYAGADRCAECHEKNHAKWEQDWHARALSKAEARYVVGRFDGTHYRGKSSEAWMRRGGEKFVMKTAASTGGPRDFPVEWVIGGKRMQDAVTTFPDGRWQVLPVYYHVTNHEWVDYNEKKQGVVSKDHPFFWSNFRRTANHECLNCHVTGLDVRYDRASHSWKTNFSDAGVACESCHGPGARHSETKAKADIVRANNLDRERSLALCGQCHGPREPIYPYLDPKGHFRPGDKYEEKFQPLVIVDGLQRSGEYFADGRPSSSSFEYQALLQSKCYMQGNATCITCHTSPHAEHVANELKPAASPGDATCRNCHANVFAAGAQHTHHKTPQAQSCVACHMPPVVTGVLDRFADHTLDVPNPRNTIAHDAPNACNVCHANQSPQQMASAIATWWPNAAKRQARRNLLADAIDEKTAHTSRAALVSVLNDRNEAPTLRAAAGVLLAQRFPADAASAIVPLLHDRDPLIRARLLEALGYARAASSADAVATLLADPGVKVRERAAVVLTMFKDPRGERALQKLATDPKTDTLVWPHLLLGQAAAARNDLDTAAREMNRALDVVPYLPDALVFLADISMRKNDPKAARAYLQEAIRFDAAHKGANRRLTALDSMTIQTN